VIRPLTPSALTIFESGTERRHEQARRIADRYPASMWAVAYARTLVTLEAVDRQFAIAAAWREQASRQQTRSAAGIGAAAFPQVAAPERENA
jgi:hypothetical protein